MRLSNYVVNHATLHLNLEINWMQPNVNFAQIILMLKFPKFSPTSVVNAKYFAPNPVRYLIIFSKFQLMI